MSVNTVSSTAEVPVNTVSSTDNPQKAPDVTVAWQKTTVNNGNPPAYDIGNPKPGSFGRRLSTGKIRSGVVEEEHLQVSIQLCMSSSHLSQPLHMAANNGHRRCIMF